MKFFNIHSLMQKLSPSQKGEFRTIGEKSAHDWKQMVLLFALLCMVVIGGGLYLFVRIVDGDLFVVGPKDQSTLKTVDQKDIEQTTEYFKKRREGFIYLQNNKGGLRNPSL